LKDLRQITVIGLGLLGGSISSAALLRLRSVKVIGYAHRPSTRRRAKQLGIASEIASDLRKSVSQADLVILATPICAFEEIFREIADVLPGGSIVTDVGSTKVLPHHWAERWLPKTVYYVGSHPIAGSEQRGIKYARDNLLQQSICILTTTAKTNLQAIQKLRRFWSTLGCTVRVMRPAEHDKIFSNISHTPHVVVAALINANSEEDLKYAGKGFIDTTRLASGSPNIWADVLLTNTNNTTKGIDKIIAELEKMKKAIKNQDKKQVENMLEAARRKRHILINYKIKKKELIS